MENKKRAAIFVFYDQDGIVDRYVEYLLADLCQNLERLVIVCNGELQSQGRSRLSVYSDCIIQRENEGYDIWGYKTGIDMLGWEEICRYDELILCNDSVMGPVYPFREMFDEMDSRKVDFWGITKHYEVEGNPFTKDTNTRLPEHIQSYFMVFRRNILSDGCFREYWAQLEMPHGYEEAVNSHEITFTAKLAEMGYTYDVYANMDDYREYTPDPVMMSPDILVSAKRCPIIKKRIFVRDYGVSLHETAGGAPARLMDYLERHTDFDVNLIWDNILRTGRLDLIAYNLQLHYILGSNADGGTIGDFNMAIIFLDSQSREISASLPQGAAVYEMSTEQLTSEEGEKIISQYDFICLLPEPTADDEVPGSSTVDLKRHIFCNLVFDSAYLEQIEECFRAHPRLGILYPPIASHGSYAKNTATAWIGVWFRQEALKEMLQVGITDRNGDHHSYYAAVVHNQMALPQQLNNQAYYLEAYRQLSKEHEFVVHEWTRCQEAHDRVLAEWRQTDEQLKSCMEAYRQLSKDHEFVVQEWTRCQESHDRVVAEWRQTDEQLKSYMEAYRQLSREHEFVVQEWTRCQESHDRVVAEWRQTDEQLKSYMEAHDRVVAEWTKTTEALRQLQAEYDVLKEQKDHNKLASFFMGWRNKTQ